MKKNLIISAIVLAVLAGGAYLALRGGKTDKNIDVAVKSDTPASEAGQAKPGEAADNIIPAPVVAPEAITEISGYKYTENYVSSTYGFSFKHPKDFTASDLPNEESEVILVQNTAKNIGVQIVISPFAGADLNITADYIKSEIPEMKVVDPREIKIGNRKGLAFTSDNEAFGGASREIWFVFNGSFYQLTTYAKFDGLLNGLFGTWKFGE